MKVSEITADEYRKHKNAPVHGIEFPFDDLGYYKSEDGTLLGVLLKCKIDLDFAWVVLGPDERGDWRCINMGANFPGLTEAFRAMHEDISKQAGNEMYPQGDNNG